MHRSATSKLKEAVLSFTEGVTEDWCYAACTNGVCPPDAAKDCMCAAGTPKQASQQQSGSAGKDWASGATLPKGTTEAAPVGDTVTTCVALQPGYSDFWCQTTCQATGTKACPEDLCRCGAGAKQATQQAQDKAMDAWEAAELKHRLDSGTGAAVAASSPDPEVLAGGNR